MSCVYPALHRVERAGWAINSGTRTRHRRVYWLTAAALAGGMTGGSDCLMEHVTGPNSVERCLDELFDQLAGTGGAGRRAFAEAEDHLRAAVADGLARGLARERAEQEAVARFGKPARIASALRVADGGLAALLLRPAFVGAWLVGSVLLASIGLSGLVAELFGQSFGMAFVSGDAPGVTYTPQRCAEYLEYVPDAGSCGAAATVHHFGEVVEYRVALGTLGLIGLLTLLAARRWTSLRDPAWTPPRSVVAVVLEALFAVAGLVLVGSSLMQLAFGLHDGVGAGLADGLVSTVLALAVTGWTILRVRRPTVR
ncbi:MAG: permease prefix domain 1-containing protein [Egibacteraceae bacterium]